VFNWPADGKLVIPDLKNQVIAATLLANGAKLKTTSAADGLTINVPATAPDAFASVIKIEVKGKVGVNATAEPKKEMKSGAID
jgi:alpha-L-fucosidase